MKKKHLTILILTSSLPVIGFVAVTRLGNFGTVTKGDLALVVPPNVTNIPPARLVEHVDVRRLELSINSPCRPFVSHVLWDCFANNPHARVFDCVATEDWFAKWQEYESRLISLAPAHGLNAESLAACLKRIRPRQSSHKACIPVAAYLAKNGRHDIWIIICKWEYVETVELGADNDGKTGHVAHADDGGKTRSMGMCHIAIWALRARNQKQVGFVRCS